MQKLLIKQGMGSSIATLFFIGCTLLIVSVQIKILGVANYGIVVLLISVFGAINILNLGAGSALVSHYSSHETKSLYWGLYSFVFFAIAFIALSISLIGSLFSEKIFNLLSIGKNFDVVVHAYWGAVLIGTSRLLSSIITSYWVATIEYVKLKVFGFLFINISVLSIIILFYAGFSIEESIFYAGVINIMTVFASFFAIVFTKIGKEGIRLEYSELKRLFADCVSFQSISILSTLATPLLNGLINNKFGLSHVSYFDVAIRLLTAGRQVLVSAIEPFFSAMTKLHNLQKKKMAYLITKKYTYFAILLSFAFMVGSYIASPIILTLWLGEEIASHSIAIVRMLSIGFAFTISTAVIYRSLLSFKYGRKIVLRYQVIILSSLVAMFFIEFDTSTIPKFSYLYSFVIAMSCLYLMFNFIFNKNFTNKKAN